MIGEIATSKMIDMTIIGETITDPIIGQIMEETTIRNREIELEVKVGKILEIVTEIIQGKDMREVEIEAEIGVEERQVQPRSRILSENRGDRKRSETRPRSNSRIDTNRDRIRSYRYREYDHFARKCPNTVTDEELGQNDSEQKGLQLLMQDNPINSDGGTEVECLNL